MNISIIDRIGPRCMVSDDGQRVYSEILDPLKRGEDVVLDFNGVRQFASPFFNFAIGQLLRELSVPVVREKLKLNNLNETGTLLVERVIENASKYYQDPMFQKNVDEVLDRQSEDKY